ncbi:MAG: S41 family peptidase [Bacteroidaceae bacterium]|nr:S41 family peptidase [Bacteroidaceae bacterium]
MKKILLITHLLCACACCLAQQGENHNSQVSRNLEVFNEIYRQLDLFYVDTLSADTVIGWGIRSMLSQVDPFTDYFPSDDEALRQMTTGKYAGIGSIIRYSKKEDRVVISEPYMDSPSYKAGVKAGDVILSIDGKDVKGMVNAKVSNMLRGEPGTTFELKVMRPGEDSPRAFQITRETIQVPSVPYYGQVAPGVGYIYLTGFTDGVCREVRQAFLDLKSQGCTQLVLDLRENPGGAVNEAVDIVNLFVRKGQKVVYTKGKMKQADRAYHTASEPIDTVMPMVVLVDGASASASEIVSGCLQDIDRAVIVGERTYGKGLVQAVREVAYRGSLKITTGRYYIPSGRCIQAYDYRHRNADGTAGTVPDSLTRVFHTRGGREVRDGGGIKPDIVVQQDSLPTLVYDLVASDEMFDYATRYVCQHDTIAPAGQFKLTDEEYADFVEYIASSGFTYNRRSDEVLEILREVAQREGYLERAQAEFDALKAKFSNDLRGDLMHFQHQIDRFVADEIVRRYYYQRGGVQQQLVDDPFVTKALEVLASPEQYHTILAP